MVSRRRLVLVATLIGLLSGGGSEWLAAQVIGPATSPNRSIRGYDLDGPREWSDIAGNPAGSSEVAVWTTINNFTDAEGINSFFIEEAGDEPCRVGVGKFGNFESVGAVWDGCAGASGTRLVLEEAPSISGIHDDPSLIVGIQVCHNNRRGVRGELVKGVRVFWAARPYTSGSDRMTRSRQEAEPNCSQWSPAVFCEDGTAADAVRVFHKPVGGRAGTVGIQLGCVEATQRCTDEAPEVRSRFVSCLRSTAPRKFTRPRGGP